MKAYNGHIQDGRTTAVLGVHITTLYTNTTQQTHTLPISTKILNMKSHIANLIFLLAGSVIAAPSVSGRSLTAVEIVRQIAPDADKCSGGTADECRKADQVAPHLIAGAVQYKIYEPAQIAAVIALEAFESVSFVYKRNTKYLTTNQGQGTANMQMANYNKMYAESIPELAASAGGAPNDILAKLIDDKYNFASGFWFLSTQCTDEVRNAMDGSDAGFEKFLVDCVGTDFAPRKEYWDRAKVAFGL